MRLLLSVGLLGLVVLGSFCFAAPKPALVQSSNFWTVDMSYTHPQQIMVKMAGERMPRRFWYTIATLTNKSKRKVDFYPQCDLMTDTFQILPSGKGVPRSVFEKIKMRHKRVYPFLESLEETKSSILVGSDNAKDVVIMWPDFAGKAKNIKLFITGLSNETAVVKHPIKKDKKIYLRKTLELNYKLGGDPTFRSDVKLIPKGKRWVMR